MLPIRPPVLLEYCVGIYGCHWNISQSLNSLAPGIFEWNFRHVISKQILVIDDWGISSEITLTWKPQDLTDDTSTLVQVMAWCRQATSHYLSQCWPSSLSPYGDTRPQWVKSCWYSHHIWIGYHMNKYSSIIYLSYGAVVFILTMHYR